MSLGFSQIILDEYIERIIAKKDKCSVLYVNFYQTFLIKEVMEQTAQEWLKNDAKAKLYVLDLHVLHSMIWLNKKTLEQRINSMLSISGNPNETKYIFVYDVFLEYNIIETIIQNINKLSKGPYQIIVFSNLPFEHVAPINKAYSLINVDILPLTYYSVHKSLSFCDYTNYGGQLLDSNCDKWVLERDMEARLLSQLCIALANFKDRNIDNYQSVFVFLMFICIFQQSLTWKNYQNFMKGEEDESLPSHTHFNTYSKIAANIIQCLYFKEVKPHAITDLSSSTNTLLFCLQFNVFTYFVSSFNHFIEDLNFQQSPIQLHSLVLHLSWYKNDVELFYRYIHKWFTICYGDKNITHFIVLTKENELTDLIETIKSQSSKYFFYVILTFPAKVKEHTKNNYAIYYAENFFLNIKKILSK